MISDFNGELEVEWLSIKDRMPLDEYSEVRMGMIANVFVLVVDEYDTNDEPVIVNINYEVSADRQEKQWLFLDGQKYPLCHRQNIRYWCYPPNYKTKQILEYEKNS